jgi:hypothetical protein
MAVKYACERCGKKDVLERMVFSHWTRRRYCSDLDACERRVKRLKRAAAAV